MARLLLLCSFAQILFVFVYGDAPADFSRTCTHPDNFRIVPPAVPDNNCVLLDSRYYVDLLGSKGVWRTFERDENGGTWRHGRGGLCTWQVRSCTITHQNPQENYLLTQYIAAGGAHEIFIDIEYRFTSGGYTRAFDVLYFETNQANAQASVDPSNYKLLNRFAPTRSSGQITFSFDTTNTRGFYVALRENGTCLTISTIRVYTYCCKGQRYGLLEYPTANAPTRSGGAPSRVTGECYAGSSVDDSGDTTTEVSCSGLGRWDTSKDCVCNPGLVYEEKDGDSNCAPCPPNTFKRFYSNLDQCDKCPVNSVSEPGSTNCSCKEGFYRSKDESSKDSCTVAPSNPLNVAVVKTDSTTCKISWDPPTSDGGRSDVSYCIEYQSTSRLFRGYLPAGTVATGSPNMFTVEGLDPVTEYTLRVVSKNGVSDQDPGSERSRTVIVTCNTQEGVPGKIDVFANTRGNTFTWQPPDKSNGVITGFSFKTFREGEEEEANHEELGPLDFCFSPASSTIPAGNNPVYVRVAAKTSVGVGEMSDPLVLEEEKQCSVLTNPSNGEVVVTTVLVGGEARYFCNDGYRLNGVSNRLCQYDENWSGSEPRCELITCGVLRHPGNGLVTLRGGSAVNAIAEYTCNEGFQPSGDSLRFCRLDGTWTEVPPVCVEVPPTAAPITLPPVACPTCPACPSCPTTPPPIDCPVITCPTIPPKECPVVTCPPPTDCPSCPTTPPPTDCPTLAPKDCPVVTCPDVTVEPTPQVACNSLVSPPNGKAEQTGTSLGSIVEYTCDIGFVLNGSARRECQAVGAWTNTAPSCKAVLCKDLLSPNNGRVQYPGTVVSSVARYTCNQGYTLSGSANRVCRFNGQWSGIQPTCNRNCEPLGDIENGKVQITGVIFGSLATYTCNAPYLLIGARRRQCLHDGWTGEEPTCQLPTCVNSGEIFSLCASTCRPTCNNQLPSCFNPCEPGCTCPAGLVLDSERSRCVDVNECRTFELNGIQYPNGSSVQLSDIGENDNGLIFRTDVANCCRNNRRGNCYDPNGIEVPYTTEPGLYRNRDAQLLRLNCRRSRGVTVCPAQGGLYCCNVPVDVNNYERVCANIVV